MAQYSHTRFDASFAALSDATRRGVLEQLMRAHASVARSENGSASMTNRTTSERKSERELVTTRIFDAPARLVFEAWTTPETFGQLDEFLVARGAGAQRT